MKNRQKMQLIKVGLCAFGMSGKVFHAPFLKEHPGFWLEGVVERTKNLCQKLYPDAIVYRSVEEMLNNKDIELVVVNTPVQTHFQYVKMALEAGKNVIVEKPFTIDSKEAEELVQLASEKNLFISVYQNRRLDRDFLQVKKFIESGKLGNIKEAEIRFDRFRTEPSGKEHKENPNLPASGALHDLGSHLVDQAIQLFGFPQKIFADIFSMKGNEFANDYFELILFYNNNLRVRVKSSVFSKEDHYAYKIFGDKGSFLQERSDLQENELVAGAIPEFNTDWVKPLSEKDGILTYINNVGIAIREILASESGNYMAYYQGIYEHIVFGYPLPSPASEVIQNMKLIDAAIESNASEQVIKL